jgi:hypothetical protein
MQQELIICDDISKLLQCELDLGYRGGGGAQRFGLGPASGVEPTEDPIGIEDSGVWKSAHRGHLRLDSAYNTKKIKSTISAIGRGRTHVAKLAAVPAPSLDRHK